MKTKTLISLIVLFPLLSFAGYDNSSTLNCDNGKYQLKIKREGSFFGENRIVIKESGSFFSSLVNEEYKQDWSPEGIYEVENRAKKEMPVAMNDFYELLLSPSVVVVHAYVNGNSGDITGERTTYYVQFKQNGAVLKFDRESQCRKSDGF